MARFARLIRGLGGAALAAILLLGATGMATAAPAPAPSATTNGFVYTVQRGDTLYSLARRFGTTVQAIMQTNGLASTAIFAGQRLFIPASQPTPSVIHIVQRGETLTRIAIRYSTTVQAIMRTNNLRSTTIYVGQRLAIPAPGHRPSPRPTVAIQPASGPSGTVVHILATGFLPHEAVSIWMALPNAEGILVARTTADANGTARADATVQGEAGAQWSFSAVATGNRYALSSPFTITGGIQVKETNVRYVLALVDVNMRSGPGLSFPIIGGVYAGQSALVTGMSIDGQWWRVICPNNIVGNCWITARPQYTRPVG
jgi:LysM repeat protein